MFKRGLIRRRDDGGAAAVEFALVVLPLCLLAFGIISFGLMLSFRQNLSQAAAEGARAAAVTLAADERQQAGYDAINAAMDASDVKCEAGNFMIGTQDAGDCAVEFMACDEVGEPGPVVDPGDPDCVVVTLTYDYQKFGKAPEFPGIGIVLPNTLTYTASARIS